MKKISIYCKSYKTDVKRAHRLAESIEKYNTDKIDFFVSCPQEDVPLFKEYLFDFNVNIIADEEIISKNPAHTPERLRHIPGNISQQIIKSEFWRLGISENYLCLDSDSKFIRSFNTSEFLDKSETPYTIVDECREITLPALEEKKQRIIDNFNKESAQIQNEIGRSGKFYNFGPNNPLWNRSVWESLDCEFLKPKNISLADLIVKYPIEMRWYGEALLKYKAIPLLPSQPFFKMYAYAWQLNNHLRKGIKESDLSQLYCGVTYQSAWERELDWPKEGGNLASKLSRRLRRKLGRM